MAFSLSAEAYTLLEEVFLLSKYPLNSQIYMKFVVNHPTEHKWKIGTEISYNKTAMIDLVSKHKTFHFPTNCKNLKLQWYFNSILVGLNTEGKAIN